MVFASLGGESTMLIILSGLTGHSGSGTRTGVALYLGDKNLFLDPVHLAYKILHKYWNNTRTYLLLLRMYKQI